MFKEIDTKVAITFIAIVALVFIGFVGVLDKHFSVSIVQDIILPIFTDQDDDQDQIITEVPSSNVEELETFASEEDFKEYLQEVQASYGFYGIGGGMGGMDIAVPLMEESMAKGDVQDAGGGIPSRVSETNVQVAGIDELDIVKTDGKEIYLSSEGIYYRNWMWDEIMPPDKESMTKVIKAFPPADLEEESEIKEGGQLLLSEDSLVIFSRDEILGFDVSDPVTPDKKWEIEMDNNNLLVTARLYKGKIYLVTRTNINDYHPCPIKPLIVEGSPVEIRCIDIYHPVSPVSVDVTYHAFIIDPSSGKIEERTSFVGSSDSVIYMSENGLYITYYYMEDLIKFYSGFFKEKCQDLVPGSFIGRLDKLSDYDISTGSKMNEFQMIYQEYMNSLDNDEALRIQNEFSNRFEDYFKDNKRKLQKTGIVKIDLSSFQIKSTGSVPGKPLNQFSLDEYNGYLRVAVTVGENFWWGMGFGSTRDSANDVYVLDSGLNIVGSVRDLGLTERIYSARFIQDRGYLVTFRQIDPFYVLDLSDPRKPEMKGELKIPGYSSYLHPISDSKILGIGKEGSQVKISLFDVQDAGNPKEIAKYTLDEYWSDILNTHHAFLLDSKHDIFFLPGSKGGYIFSYLGDKLEMKKAVSSSGARRAIYIEDYLYIIGEREIVVLNEIDWTEVNDLEL